MRRALSAQPWSVCDSAEYFASISVLDLIAWQQILFIDSQDLFIAVNNLANVGAVVVFLYSSNNNGAIAFVWRHWNWPSRHPSILLSTHIPIISTPPSHCLFNITKAKCNNVIGTLVLTSRKESEMQFTLHLPM